MSFSDKMRDSLGGQGARIEVVSPDAPVAPGASARVSVRIQGGSQPATVEALLVRLVQADRHWVAADGTVTPEADAPPREARQAMTAGWDRTPIAELRVQVGHTVQAGEHHTIEVEVPVPPTCVPTSAACNHTVNVQADIRGQIDPSGNARVTIG